MIETITLYGNISTENSITGSLNLPTEYIEPKTEQLTVEPKKEQQIFEPSLGNYYNKVTIEPIPDRYVELINQEKMVRPSEEVQEIKPDVGYTGLSKVTVDKIILQKKTITPSKDFQDVICDDGYVGLSGVKVNPIPDNYIEPAGTLDISENGTYDITEYSDVKVSVGGEDIVITNATFLFRSNARLDIVNELLSLCGKLTTMADMFNYSNKLTEVDVSKLDTSDVKDMGNAFASTGLKKLDISNFDMSKVNNIAGIFYGITLLEDLSFGYNLGKGFTQKTANYFAYRLAVSSSNQLTHDSLMSIINGLYDLNLTYDVANGGTLYQQQLVLGATNIAKLTSEEIAIATNKGWVVS